MKRINKIVCSILALVIFIAQLPITALAYNENVPSFTAEQKDVVSQDGKWKYDIALDKNEEPRVWIKEYLEIAQAGKDFVFPGVLDGMKVQSVDMYPSSNLFNIKKNTKIVFEENIEIISGEFLRASQNLEVVLPSTLLMIDQRVFASSVNLKINFPDSLCAIAKEAFQFSSFSTNTDIVLPESLKYIGNGAFEKTNITSVKIGAKTDFSDAKFSQTAGVYYTGSVTYPYTPFINCGSLTKIEIDDNNPNFKNDDGIIYTADDKELVFINESPADYAIPESVEYICSGVFNNKNFNSLIIPSNLKKFYSVTFSNTNIGKLSFAEGFEDDSFSELTFKDCTIEELTIPKSIALINHNTFKNHGIKKLYFEEGSALAEIGAYAFKGNNFETLDLTNCRRLTVVQTEAFSTNKSLLSVDMTDVPLEEFSSGIFSGCSKLKDFNISKYTKTIGYNAFSWDTELENIDLSNIVKYENGAFDRCDKVNVSDIIVSNGTTEDGFEYVELENHVSLIGYTGNSLFLSMPDTINGKPVTDIVWTAAKLKSSKLLYIKFPSSLAFISSGAFQYKDVLKVSDFPKTLRYIGKGAFSGGKLTSVKLNEGLEYVLSGAFASCPIINLEIPDSVCFYLGMGYGVANSITFGKNVQNIKQILENASGDGKSKSIQISFENPYYSFEDGVLYNGDKTHIYKFYSCYNADEIADNYKIPESVKTIDKSAFYQCNVLGDLIIPAGVEFIGANAFESSSITSAHFADGFKTERLYRTFFACKSLQNVTFGDVDIKVLAETYVDSSIKNVEIPDSVERLSAPYMMTDLSSVTELNLPKNLKYIGGAFEGTKISITELTLPEGLKSVGPYAFAQCKMLKSIDFSNVEFLERAAFLGCDALESVDLTGITYIKEEYDGTFSDCPNLKKITFNREDREHDIEDEANKGNTAVETVVIGNGINSVKSKAFADCKNLKTAVISPSVNSIADDAFENCGKLTIVCTENSTAHEYAQRNSVNYKTFKILPVPDQTYTGKEIKPALHIVAGEKELEAGREYTASYANNIRVGTARATAVGLGDYSIFAATVNFNIVAPPHTHSFKTTTVKPTYEKAGYTLHTCSCGYSYKSDFKAKLTVPATSIKKLTTGKKSVTVSFNKVKNVSGYQLQFSTSKNFDKNKKTVTLSNPKTAKRTVKNLKSKKKYYVRIRTYKKVGKKIYYSAWSKAKTVKTK